MNWSTKSAPRPHFSYSALQSSISPTLSSTCTTASAGELEDGAEVQFFYYDSKSLTRFKLNGRQLAVASGMAANLRAPLTEARGLTISDWKDTYTPKLNAQALKLGTNERSRSLALAPDGGLYLPAAYPKVDAATLARHARVFREARDGTPIEVVGSELLEPGQVIVLWDLGEVHDPLAALPK